MVIRFQYISCYCLSIKLIIPVPRLEIFQYISCYCLSSLYSSILLRLTDFNTSHVTVYHHRKLWGHQEISISIHLMLLFIYLFSHTLITIFYFNTSHVTVYRHGGLHNSVSTLFQYISCYCLSSRHTDSNTGRIISIHLMLLFISVPVEWLGQQFIFQYISCYCLSRLSAGRELMRW